MRMTLHFLILFLPSTVLDSRNVNNTMVVCGAVDGTQGFHARQALCPLSTSPSPFILLNTNSKPIYIKAAINSKKDFYVLGLSWYHFVTQNTLGGRSCVQENCHPFVTVRTHEGLMEIKTRQTHGNEGNYPRF